MSKLNLLNPYAIRYDGKGNLLHTYMRELNEKSIFIRFFTVNNNFTF